MSRILFVLSFFLVSFDCFAIESDSKCLEDVWIEIKMNENDQNDKLCLVFSDNIMIFIWLTNDEISMVYSEKLYFVPSDMEDLPNITIGDVRKFRKGTVYFGKKGADDDNMLISEYCFPALLDCSDDDMFINSAIYRRSNLSFDKKIEVYNRLGYFPQLYLIKSKKSIVYDSSFAKTAYALPQDSFVEVIGDFQDFFKVMYKDENGDVVEGYIHKKDVDYEKKIE